MQRSRGGQSSYSVDRLSMSSHGSNGSNYDSPKNLSLGQQLQTETCNSSQQQLQQLCTGCGCASEIQSFASCVHTSSTGNSGINNNRPPSSVADHLHQHHQGHQQHGGGSGGYSPRGGATAAVSTNPVGDACSPQLTPRSQRKFAGKSNTILCY